MKDIRPALNKIEKILKSKAAPHKIVKDVEEVINRSPLRGTKLSQQLAPCGWGEGLGKDCGCEVCLAHFEKDREDSLSLIKELKTPNWPDSSNALVVSYSKPGAGFGLKILIQVSGLRVECPYEDLKKEIEKSIAGLNQNQSADNFLLNAIYVLPEEYKDFKLQI